MRKGLANWQGIGSVAAGIAVLLLAGGTAVGSVIDAPIYSRWESFTRQDGLPADKVFAVRIDGDRVWAGTTAGLAKYENGRWQLFGTADGLPHPVVLSLDLSPRTGDLWIGTMGGLARWSGGRFDVYTQMNSGLPNDVVNGVRCDPDEDSVWVATAMGAARFNLISGEWTIFTHRNTPMHEPWTYSIAFGNGAVYVGAWGGGVLEYDKATGRWREYRDPDKEFELDLFPDDGPVSDVTAGIDFGAGHLWQITYTGATRYDGREWRSYFTDDSGLASNFINFVRVRGKLAWMATDRGLSMTDGDDWVTYRRREDGGGEVSFFRGGREVARSTTATAPAHNYILGVDVAGDEIWLATSKGVSRGIRSESTQPTRSAPPVDADDGKVQEARFAYAGTPGPLQPFRDHRPYRDLFTERIQFLGTGAEVPDPEGLREVRIGFIGPLEERDGPILPPGVRPVVRPGDPKILFGRRMLRAATLAVEEANRDGGYRGLPFRIIARTDLVLWGQTSNELVRFVGEDGVWAVMSSVDSNHNHVLSRTALKAEVAVLTAGSTDPTLVEHTIPWLVRCINDDRQNAYVLLNEIFQVRKLKRVALLRVNDRDGRTGVDEFVSGARRLGHPVVIEMRFANGDTDFLNQLARIRQTAADALVIWGNPPEAARAIRQLREHGDTTPVFGFDRIVQQQFLELAGAAAEGVVAVATMNPDPEYPLWEAFHRSYRDRWGEEPDSFAAHAYDGMNILIGAIRAAGLNRTRIRDALFSLATYRGATGEIRFDTNMNDIGTPWLAVVREGRFHYYPAPAWPEGDRGKDASQVRELRR